MTPAVAAGATVGLGLYLLARLLLPVRPGLGAAVARVDAARRVSVTSWGRAPAPPTGTGRIAAPLGRQLADFYAAHGWQQASMRADLAILGLSWEGHLARKVLWGAAGLLLTPVATFLLFLVGFGDAATPLWTALLCALVGFLMPDSGVRHQATARRRDFRHVVGAYLDLVSMNLSGGRGVPEALMAAAEVGGGWALRRLHDALVNARLAGLTQWEALGRLGDELAVPELRDLASALGLVADDGAKIRSSLAARAATMRAREIAETEGKAGERSQSMLVAQLLLCSGFLIFLAYPAVVRVFQS